MKIKMILAAVLVTCWLVMLTRPPSGFAQQSKPVPPADSPNATAATIKSSDEDESKKQTTSFWMEQKLRFSTEILVGLARSDFEMIGKNAELMQGLNRIETFVRRRPEGYHDELRLFNSANKALIESAASKNLEGATLAFNRLTVSCVSCHQHLRKTE